MKEVEKGSTKAEEFEGFVATLKGYRARPMEKVVVSFVRLRTEDSMAASPKRRRFEELKLVLKTNSVVDETQLEPRIVVAMAVTRNRGKGFRDIWREREK
ncbi:hypothetical protein PanWU01x14_228380, partial [Parasponia andersonii]